MKKKLSIGLAAALLLGVLAGCSSSAASGSASSAAASLDFSGATLTGTVTAVSGSDITLTLSSSGLGSTGAGMGDMNGMPDAGGMPSETADADAGASAELPSGENGSALPDTATTDTGTTFVLTIHDAAILQKDENGETASAALSDIAEGDLLTIVFGADGAISSVTIAGATGFDTGAFEMPGDAGAGAASES